MLSSNIIINEAKATPSLSSVYYFPQYYTDSIAPFISTNLLFPNTLFASLWGFTSLLSASHIAPNNYPSDPLTFWSHQEQPSISAFLAPALIYCSNITLALAQLIFGNSTD